MPATLSELWSILAIPLLIFFARVADVSMGTLRIVMSSRGMRRLAPLFGFVEVTIWLLAIGHVVHDLDDPLRYVAFAAGFGAGTWLGLWLEEKLAFGLLAVRIVTRSDATELIEKLSARRFGVTSFAARGIQGRVRLILTVIRRSEQQRLMELVHSLHPDSFITVSDVRLARQGYLAPESRLRRLLGLSFKK